MAFIDTWNSREERHVTSTALRPEIAGALTNSLREGLSGALDALEFLLERLDFMPGLQPSPHDAKVKLLHENELLIHFQQNIPSDFLLLENFAVF